MGEFSIPVSFTPLEVPAHIEGGRNYLDYWTRHEEADADLAGTRQLRETTHAGSAYIRDPDGRSPIKVIGQWDGSLGSFNHMQHGAGDLVRGAALLLRASYEGGPDDFPVVRLHDPKCSVDAFLDVALQMGDMADQRPSREMRLGGQLVHKAALIEREPARQEALFGVARTIYAREYDADTPWDKQKLHTGQLIADIDFHGLSRKIRQACRAKQGTKGLKRQAAALLQGQTEDLLRYKDMIDNGHNADDIAGEVSELMATIAVRQLIYLASDVKGNHSQIRTALDSEEHPEHPRGTRQKRAFDRVYTRVDENDNVIGARMWQLKWGFANEGEYHPSIDVVCIRGIGMRDVFKLGKSLRQAYASGNYQSQAAPLPLVSQAVKPFMRPAAKAA